VFLRESVRKSVCARERGILCVPIYESEREVENTCACPFVCVCEFEIGET